MAEAEYVAATRATKEAFEFIPFLTSPTTLCCDNQAAIESAIGDNYLVH
jgi:hypothetical protein